MGEPSGLTELVSRAAAGDQAAWDEIVERFSAMLWAVARSHRLDSDTAADVVQSTWLRLVQHLDRIVEPRALPGWLLTTVRRESLRAVRLQGREEPVREDDAPDVPDPVVAQLDEHLLADERDAVVVRCFALLSPRCQTLLRILTAADRPPYAAIAAELGVPIGSLGPTRARCLAALRERLAATGYDFDGSQTGGAA